MKIEAILYDIKIKMDGVEVLEAVKKNQKPEIPMVMISSHGDLKLLLLIRCVLDFDYISKPI